jgi:hypothetical protein
MSQTAKIRVRVTCKRCGDERLGIDDIVLRLGVEDGSWGYRFRCSACGLAHLAPASQTAVAALLEAGVATECGPMDAEQCDSGPATPITDAEVLECVAVLADDDRLAAALATLRAPRG